MKNYIITWGEFEHTLNYLLCGLDTPISDNDFMDLSEIKQTIIVFSLGKTMGERNEIFLENSKHFFFESIDNLKKNHPTIMRKLDIIQKFVEENLFS